MSKNRIAIATVLTHQRHEAFLQYCKDNHLTFLDEITPEHYAVFKEHNHRITTPLRATHSTHSDIAAFSQADKSAPFRDVGVKNPPKPLDTHGQSPLRGSAPPPAKDAQNDTSVPFADDMSCKDRLALPAPLTAVSATADTPIRRTNLSKRAAVALKSAGILTLDQLANTTEEDLKQIPYLNAQSIAEILPFIDKNHPPTQDSFNNYVSKHRVQVPFHSTALFADAPIEHLHLSVRSTNALKSAHIHTVKQLMGLNDETLHKTKNLGAKSVKEILDAMKKINADAQNPLSRHAAAAPSRAKHPSHFSLSADTPIEHLNLSVRSTNALKRADIVNVGQMAALDIEKLFAMKNIGVKSVKEILAVIENLKIYLEDNQPYTLGKVFEEAAMLLPRLSGARASLLIEDLLLDDDENPMDISLLDEEEQPFATLIAQSIDIIGRDMALMAYCHGSKLSSLIQALDVFHFKTEQQNSILYRCERMPSQQLQSALFYARFSISDDPTHPYGALRHLLCGAETVADLHKAFFITPPDDETCKTMLHFLDFATTTYPLVLEQTLNSALSKLKSAQIRSILARRSAGETLQTLGDEMGVTRERIRQIEAKNIKKIATAILRLTFDPLLVVCAAQGEKFFITLEEIKNFYRTVEPIDIFLRIITDADIYFNPYLVFDKDNDVFVFASVQNDINTARQRIAQLPRLLADKDAESLLEKAAAQSGLNLRLLHKIFHATYTHQADFYRKGRPTLSEIYQYMLLTYYPTGMKIYDEEELARLRTFITTHFEDITLPESDRAISARIDDVAVLCDRGTYIHPQHIRVEPSVIDEVLLYIRNDDRTALSFHELFEIFKDKLISFNVTNRYFLQGVLRYYNPDEFYLARDYITKEKDVGLTLELEAFVHENGIVRKEEIFEAFPGFTEVMVSLKLGNSKDIIALDNGYYMHAELLDMRAEDHCIGHILRSHTARYPLSSRKLHEILRLEHPAFLARNGIAEHGELFGIIKYLYEKEFAFSRPFIAKIDAEDITNLSVLLEHLAPYRYIELDDLISLCEKHHLLFTGIRNLIRSLNDEFLRLDSHRLCRYDPSCFTEEALKSTLCALQEAMGPRGFVVGSKLDDFSAFPSLPFAWNAFFLRSVVERYFSETIDIIHIPTTNKHLMNAVFVSPRHKVDDYESLLVALLRQQHGTHAFSSKEQALHWLAQEELYLYGVPKYLSDDTLLRTDSLGTLQIGKEFYANSQKSPESEDTIMLGAIVGDIVGSIYEFNNIKTKSFPLFSKHCFFTDDTVMTVAVSEAIKKGATPDNFIDEMKTWGRSYPRRGYGLRFDTWLVSDNRDPYNSWGNGSAMRAGPCGWAVGLDIPLEQGALKVADLAAASAAVTHNHPEGIKGAKAAALGVYFMRYGAKHGDIKTYKTLYKDYITAHYGYDLERTLDEIRPVYYFNESCQETVPEAIIAFLESTDFEDAIRNAISIGGDSDTVAAITGAIAEAAYGIPPSIRTKTLTYLDDTLRAALTPPTP